MMVAKEYKIKFRKAMLFAMAFIVVGCARYQTPGAGVNVGNLSKADADIAEVMKREPAAPFPTRLAIARAQATGYHSKSNTCYGKGLFCIVTTRDIETDKDFERLSRLPMISGIAAMNRILLPEKLDAIKDLRLTAANLKTDMLLVYSLDTQFKTESTDIGPLALVSLGFIPNKNLHITTTTSAALFDVRTGFVYGVAEATVTERQRATVWSSESALETARLKTEADSFRKLLGEFEGLWKGIVAAHIDNAK